MFKTLIGLAMAIPALADSVKDDLAEMQCQAMTTTSGTIFNVRGIEGTDDYVWELQKPVAAGPKLNTLSFGNKCAKASDCSQGCSRDHCKWSWPTGGS